MNEMLRREYMQLLAQRGADPRPLPPDREELMRAMAQTMYEEAKRRGDPMADAFAPEVFEKNKDRYLAETRHPATIAIDKACNAVEATIRSIPSFAQGFAGNIFAGEFPTGSVNCEVVKAQAGYLILVNSGLITVLHQVCEFLWMRDANDPANAEADETTISGVIDVMTSYLRYRDPYFGPKPVSGGLQKIAVAIMTDACMKFVVAHEYGHVLAGHFSAPLLHQMETRAGRVEVIKKQWDQEFEADDVAFRLILGTDDLTKVDLTVIDRGRSSDDPRVLVPATEMKCAIAAPFVFLTMAKIIEEVSAALSGEDRAKFFMAQTHPPAGERMARLADKIVGWGSYRIGFIDLPGILMKSLDRIRSEIVRKLTA